MKSVLFGWLLGLGLLASHVGCLSIRLVGDGCETGACGGGQDCEGIGSCGSLRSRIADHIRSKNCGSACGEIYWDEHINEPPVCDPCGCNGEFECGSVGSCPTAWGRLKNLWGTRYVPTNCEECSSCGNLPIQNGSGSCSTCAGNTHAEYPTEGYSAAPTQTMTNRSTGEARGTRVPTPASKPKPERSPNAAPIPFPDSNAHYRQDAPAERFTIGSGVTPNAKTTLAKPVAANSQQFLQSKPRLVTNPR